jgi:deoxyribonuclease V
MLACVDVAYRGEQGPAVAACLVFADWGAAVSHEERVVVVPQVAPYVAGQFFRRELPCILEVLATCEEPLDAIVVDGHVWLDPQGNPGLGAYLHRALGETAAVIGVAKNPYRDAHVGRQVLRGTSRRPLFVTSVGMSLDLAAQNVRRMHGEHRKPTLLQRVDRACRQPVSISRLGAQRDSASTSAPRGATERGHRDH